MAEEEQDTVQVRFLADALYENVGRGRGTSFKAGKVYDMPEEHAQRWIRRNAAELVEPPEDRFPEVEAKPRRGRPPKSKASEEDSDSPTEQAQQLAESGPGPLKPQHAVPHPSQSEPADPKAKAEFDVATAPKSEPKADMTDSNKSPGPKHVDSSPQQTAKASDKVR